MRTKYNFTTFTLHTKYVWILINIFLSKINRKILRRTIGAFAICTVSRVASLIPPGSVCVLFCTDWLYKYSVNAIVASLDQSFSWILRRGTRIIVVSYLSRPTSWVEFNALDLGLIPSLSLSLKMWNQKFDCLSLVSSNGLGKPRHQTWVWGEIGIKYMDWVPRYTPNDVLLLRKRARVESPTRVHQPEMVEVFVWRQGNVGKW